MAELQVKLPSAKKRRRKRRFERPKFCRFCGERGLSIDYKEPKNLRIFLTEEGKILPRRISGNCAKHQRKLTIAVKRARHLALLPMSPTHL